MKWPRRLAIALAVATAVVIGAAAVAVATSPSVAGALLVVAAVLLAAPACLSGLAVSNRQPAGALGPSLVVPGLLAAIVAGAAAVNTLHLSPLPGDDYATAASQGAWVLVYVVIAVPLLLFPEGRPSTRFARWLLGLILADAALMIVVFATAPGPFLPPNQGSPHVFGTMPGVLSGVLSVICLPGLALTLIALAVYLVRRYRASGSGRRRQFRWLALGAWLLPVTLVSGWLSYAVFGNGDAVLAVGLAVAFLALPVVIAVAVVRPELFDVDRVISATVVHTAFTAALLAVFTVVDALVGLGLAHRAPTVAVAVTALIALLLAPARGRVQHRIDRWLYPARQAAYHAIDELHRDTLMARARPEELEGRLRDALRDPALVVAYRTPVDGRLVDAEGVAVDVAEHHRRTDVALGGEAIGILAVRAPISTELLRDIASRAAPLVELTRLRVELSRALREADESRARLLRVGYEERVRLERDLHDGAQQRLVSLGMSLRLAQRRMSRGAPSRDVSGVLDAAVTELGTAVSELRQLAHGIRPSCLDDGLVPALSSLVTSAPIPITLQVAPLQLEPALETTAYYVAAEAIANALKHAAAQHITLVVSSDDGHLRVKVTDDGTGLADARQGTGLVGLADRVGAHGGRLAIDSRRGVGTVVEAVVPCAS